MHSGLKFDYVEPKPDMIALSDIARGLARLPRYLAQTNMLMTVAEHCMYVADNVPEEVRLEALLHDAAEAYTGDIPSPLKHLIKDSIKPIEQRIERAIADRFKLQYPWPKAVKDMDGHALFREAAYFVRPSCIENWNEAFRVPGIRSDDRHLVRKQMGQNPNAAKLTEQFTTMCVGLMLKRGVRP